jgi:prephenate dehydrogenase
MTVEIAIIGLGQIGTSIGLALGEHSELVHRTGHDRELSVARAAEKKGALDQVKLNVLASVRDADLVLLCLPLDELHQTLKDIAANLKAGAIVMDTAPAKGTAAEWAESMLPAGCHYVGLVPVINPDYLHGTETGVEAARADLFQRGLMLIGSPSGTSAEAIRLASDLTRLLGASPLFIDLAEADGLLAATHVLPQLAAVALLEATVDQPGWREGRKLAGRAYAGATGPVAFQDSAGALRDAALHNRENVVRVLDDLIASLQALRQDISSSDAKSLGQRLEQVRKSRQTWLDQRLAADWLNTDTEQAELPSLGEYWQRMLAGIRKRPGPKKDK